MNSFKHVLVFICLLMVSAGALAAGGKNRGDDPFDNPGGNPVFNSDGEPVGVVVPAACSQYTLVNVEGEDAPVWICEAVVEE